MKYTIRMPMQKYLLSAFLLVGLLSAGIVFADHGEETGVNAVDSEEAVTSVDLGVEDAGILPTSRLYFFKELGRGIQSLFTFGSVKKAELELRFTNEKAAEIKEVQETQPNNKQAIAKALGNYQKSQERLKIRLESLKETSENPNVDRLLDRVTENAVKHAKLVEEIAFKTKDIASLQELAITVREKIEESTFSGAAKDDPVKFAARLEKSLVESAGGELKHLRSITLIDRISEKASEDVKKSLEGLREEFSDRLQGDLKTILEKKTPEDLSRAIGKVPGDTARQSVILEEIRAKSTEKIAESLKESANKLKEAVQEGENISQKAVEQMKHAQEKVLELEKKMIETSAVSDAVQKILTQAKEHLANAEKSLQEKEYGRAFGQATSAEVIARNGLRLLEQSKKEQGTKEEKKEELGQEIRELTLKLQKYEELVKAKGFTLEQNPEIFQSLVRVKNYTQQAQDVFLQGDLVKSRELILQIKTAFRELGQAIELKARTGKPQGVNVKKLPESAPSTGNIVVPPKSIVPDLDKRNSTVCGNGVCESQEEQCVSSSVGGSSEGGFFATTDCGPSYCPQDCEAGKIQK